MFDLGYLFIKLNCGFKKHIQESILRIVFRKAHSFFYQIEVRLQNSRIPFPEGCILIMQDCYTLKVQHTLRTFQSLKEFLQIRQNPRRCR